MAAKPKLTPEQWAHIRATWEADPRKPMSWLTQELNLPVSVEALRQRSKLEGWSKGGETPKTKLGKSKKTKLGNQGTSIKKTPQKPNLSEVVQGLDQFGTLSQVTDMEELFIREYMVDWNGTQAAIRAGYSAKSASRIAHDLLKKHQVRNSIEALASERARRLGIDAEELMRLWASVVAFDANELTEHRRTCCPYCWGLDHQRQYTPAGLDAAKGAHERERLRLLKINPENDIGDFPDYVAGWYDKRRPPAPDCPECFGDGLPEVYVHDTRYLSPAARLVYAGVKEGKEGIEILAMSKEKAFDNLARALGMFKDRDVEVSVNITSNEQLFAIYEEKMQQARARQSLVLAERKLTNREGD